MRKTIVRFWENRSPDASYFKPVDPYREPPVCNINLLALSRYAKSVGKKITDLTHDEISKFFADNDEV